MCAHIYYRLESVHIYTTRLHMCTYICKVWVCAHVYDMFECVYTYIWQVWVCVQIYMVGLSMCAHIYGRFVHVHIYTADLCVCARVTAPVMPSKDHVPCCIRGCLLSQFGSVWKCAQLLHCPGVRSPEHHRPELSQGLSYTRVGKGTENSTTHSASRVRKNQGLRVWAVLVQEKLRQSSKQLRLNI